MGVTKIFSVKLYLGLVATQHVFAVSNEASFKPVSTAIGTSQKIEISPVASLHIILFTKRITKALIRLRGCEDITQLSYSTEILQYGEISLSQTV